MDHRLVFNLSLLELMLKGRFSRRLGCFHRLPIDVLQKESKVSSTLHSLRKLAILRTEMGDSPFQVVTDVFIRFSQFHQLTVGELEALNLGELAKDGRPCHRIWNILRLVLVGDRTSPHHIKSAFGFGLRNVGRHIALGCGHTGFLGETTELGHTLPIQIATGDHIMAPILKGQVRIFT